MEPDIKSSEKIPLGPVSPKAAVLPEPDITSSQNIPLGPVSPKVAVLQHVQPERTNKLIGSKWSHL
jgi:hypothetical protein